MSYNLNTGDILLCSGNGIASQVIIAMNKVQAFKSAVADGSLVLKWTNEYFDKDLSLQLSHLALAINITREEIETNTLLWQFIKRPGIHVFESTTGNVDWSGISGVQINPFSKWKDEYDGRIWGRHLSPEPRPDNIRFIKDMIKLIGTPYESGIPGLLELALTFNDDIRIDTPQLHCTEAGVVVNKLNRLFKPETDAHKMPPCHFGDGREIEKLVTCEISPMFVIKE